ncbi:MAG: diaminopimelate epimerase [Desulfuromonadales bacterium]|nr:diaminopimelate epimerase [Desulfuromonadales bacterium]
MRFTKMHGAGNDYIYIDGGSEQVTEPADLARKLSDRHFGVGGDGLILILPSESADLRMRIFNADGSEAEMCGNGLRCVAKYAYDRQLVSGCDLTIETGAGLLPVRVLVNAAGRVDRVRVNMGRPRLNRAALPMTGAADEQVIDAELQLADRSFRITCVSMGNPHCVIFVDGDVDLFPVETYGPLLENHPLFPQRTNVEFVQVLSPEVVRQRTWERGAGETLACGTGAAAVTVAGLLTGRTAGQLRNRLRGGELQMEWDGVNEIFMTGPAVEVFQGDYAPC